MIIQQIISNNYVYPSSESILKIITYLISVSPNLPPPPMEEMITWYFVFEFFKNIIKSIAPVGRNLNRILIKMSSQKLVSSPPQAIFFDISDLQDNFLFDFWRISEKNRKFSDFFRKVIT